MASFWSLDGDDDGYDDDDEYDPRPYCGGFDLYLTYGKSIPPSDETCYPISGNTGDFDYERPKYGFSHESSYGFSGSDHYASKPVSYSYGGEEYSSHTDDKEAEASKEILTVSSDNDENDSDGGIKQEMEAEMARSPLPHSTSTSSPAGGYKIKKFKFSSLIPWGLPKLRSTSSTSQNHKINKRKEPTKWDGITTFTYSALVQATSNFNKSNELGKGGFGKVYRGDLLCTKVAIKILHREGDASQEQAFRREVDTLCRVSHPHLVQLMGVCPERYALVYEFMEGGTLEDRLVRKDIPWQDRIRIAVEICSALVFLHSRTPDMVVHGDLKPANILLDASGISKLGDFGICRIISPSNTTTTAYITATNLQGSDGYVDPVLKQNSKLQPSIDVYSFGMIALRLLTNDRPGHGLVIDVEEALSEKRLEGVLDTTAGWPSQLAEELSDLAFKCCDLHVKRRPHLQEVCEKLEEMRNKASSA